MANKKTGRGTKYTTATVTKLTNAVERGATYRLACQYARIAESTFYEWMSSRQEFSEAIKAAEAECSLRHLENIEQHALSSDGSWQASAWLLERRHPTEYGKTVQETQAKHEHSGPNGAPIPISYFDAHAALAAATSGPGTDREDA